MLQAITTYKPFIKACTAQLLSRTIIFTHECVTMDYIVTHDTTVDYFSICHFWLFSILCYIVIIKYFFYKKKSVYKTVVSPPPKKDTKIFGPAGKL